MKGIDIRHRTVPCLNLKNPDDEMAWLSLGLDVIDVALPGVSGLGEASKIYRAYDTASDAYSAYKVYDTMDDTSDAIKAVKRNEDFFDVSGGACFVAGTDVLTESGYKDIEKIREGMKVFASNPKTGEQGLKTVVRTFVNETSELIYLQISGETIITTPDHPFYVPQKGWICAIDLRAGEILVTVNGEYVIVEKVQHEILESPIKVYNFEVEDFHTYYVGCISVLVHNDCSIKPTPINQLQEQVKRGQAPRTILRVDAANKYTPKPHIHFTDGKSLNLDGTIHDKKAGVHILTNDESSWLLKNGWR